MSTRTRGELMIVKFFKRGGVTDNKFSTGGESAKNYLLNKRVEQGTAQLLKGDSEETTEIINGLGFSKIFTSGCLSFDSEESQRISDSHKYKIMQEFERALFGDFDKTRVSGYWVEHTDKKNEKTGESRLELNFVFANVDLMTGKNLPVYYHKNDLSRINDFKDLTNLVYDLSDPNAPERKQTSVISINQSQNQKDLKQAIDNHLIELANQNKLPNHDSVKQALTDLGLEITAIKKSSISIKNPDPEKTRPIRLTGAFYEQQYKFSDLINRAENSTDTADRQQRIDELSSRFESRIAKRTSDLFHRMRTRKGANADTARAKFEPVQFSPRQDTPTDPSDYQPTDNNPLYTDLGVIKRNSFDSDPSLVHAKTANNSFSYGGHSRFIDHILPGLQSPTTQQRNGINNNEQRNNADSQTNVRSHGAKARASFREFTDAIIKYIDDFEFGTKASIRLFDTAVASERSSDQQLRNGIEQTKAVARSSTQGNNNKRIKADTQPEQAPSPIDHPTPPTDVGSEKANKGQFSELEYFYGLVPPIDSDPTPHSSPKLQDYGLVPPSNADQIIIEHGEKNATGKRENNKRHTRY